MEGGAHGWNRQRCRTRGGHEHPQQRRLAADQRYTGSPRLRGLRQVGGRLPFTREAGGHVPVGKPFQPSPNTLVRRRAQIRLVGEQALDSSECRQGRREGPRQSGVVGQVHVPQPGESAELGRDRARQPVTTRIQILQAGEPAEFGRNRVALIIS